MLRKFYASIALLLTMAALTPAAMAETKIGLRTFYMNRDFSGGNTESREAFTQALRFDHETMVTESLTVGASLFANARLADSGDSHKTGLLDTESGKGYAKLAQIFAEYNVQDAVSLRAGRWVMDTPLLNDSDSRATPSSTQAVQLTGHYKNASAYLIYSDRASAKTDDEFNRYEDKDGNEYEVVIAGGDLKFDNGLAFAAAYGDADGYMSQGYLDAGYALKDKATFRVIHYIGEGEDTNAAFDAQLTNISASYTLNSLKLSTGYQTVTGDSGYDYSWDGFENDDNSLMTSNSVQIMDFNREDEDSWQVRADYSLAALPGLGGMVRHTMGEYTDANRTVDEAETNVELSYKVSGSFLDGLKLRMRYAHVEADAYEDIDEIRLIVNYSI